MKLGMVVYGSNGDVEMFVALALELIKNNHQVSLYIITINERDYTFLSEHEGLSVHQKMLATKIRNNKDNNIEFWDEAQEDRFDLADNRYKVVRDDVINYSIECCQKMDMVIGPEYVLELPCIAEKYDTPFISLRTFPGNIRSTFETPFWAPLFPGKSREELWDIGEAYTNKYHKRAINKYRKQLGLDVVSNVTHEVIHSDILNLISYSNHLHKGNPDWPENIQLCGYFKTPDEYADWEIPEKLAEFIDADKPPVLISLGTMLEYENNKEGFHDLLSNVSKQLNRKVIFHSDWDHPGTVDENIYRLSGFISYPKLLAHCSLVVYHAGVGTMHIVAECGCPSVLIEYGFEQPFNAMILQKMGISSGSIPRAELTIDNLLELVNNALEDNQMTLKAKEIGKLLSVENGVRKAAQLIEEKFNQLLSKNELKYS